MHERDSGDDHRDRQRDRDGGLPTRIHPQTGKKQVQLEGALGPYWQDRDKVTIDESGYGQHIDWD